MSSMLLLSLLACLIAGAAIDTGNICVVRAAGDLAAGKPAIAASVTLAVAAASAVYFVETFYHLHRQPTLWMYPTAETLAGAVTFAMGALVNGACAIGTLGRLARGDIGYLATVGGGLVVLLLIAPKTLADSTADLPAVVGGAWLAIVVAVSAIALVLCRRHLRLGRLVSNATLGLTTALVLNWQGDWTWVKLIQELGTGVPIQRAAAACLLSVVLGATFTAIVKGHFRFVWPEPARMLREAGGGGLMVTGGLMIPGGNDYLLVYGLPSGSPHAVAAYVFMFGLMLIVLRRFRKVRLWTFPGEGSRPPAVPAGAPESVAVYDR